MGQESMIIGAPRVGERLEVRIGAVAPALGARFQWEADGEAIEGATWPAYRVRPGDVGRQISVRVSHAPRGSLARVDSRLVAGLVPEAAVSVSERGRRLREYAGLGRILDAADFGVVARPEVDNTAALTAALMAAHEERAALLLPEGTIHLRRQLRIGAATRTREGVVPAAFQAVTGLIGSGMGRTRITFDWSQEGSYDPSRNPDGARRWAGILIEGLTGFTIADLTVAYLPGEWGFYRPAHTYWGLVNGICLNDVSRALVDGVEATGCNRAGILLTSLEVGITDTWSALTEHRIPIEEAITCDDNTIRDCLLHHNRVAGCLLGNQRRFVAEGCRTARNGHPLDGGTGYGIGALGGSYNFGVTYRRCFCDHDYRKGLDTHEGNDLVIEDNLIVGARLYGIGTSGDAFPLERAVFRRNIIICDPAFRLPQDDGDTRGENPPDLYDGWNAINLLPNISNDRLDLRTKGPGRFEFTDNVIMGVDVYRDAAATYGIVVRNREPIMDYELTVSGNLITGRAIKSAITIVNETVRRDGTPGLGSGTILVEDNWIAAVAMAGRPSALFYIAELSHDGTLRGRVRIARNRILVLDRGDSGPVMDIGGNARVYEIDGNTMRLAGSPSGTAIALRGEGAASRPTVLVRGNSSTGLAGRGAWIENRRSNGAAATLTLDGNTSDGRPVLLP